MIFFQIIFFIFLGTYLLGFLGRLWLRWFVAKKQREFAEGKNPGGFFYGTSFGGNNNKTKTKKEGEINVEQLKKPTEKKVKEKVGDYVDFEELK